MAHELRTPIQVLLGYIDILRDEWSRELSSEPREIVERMNTNVHDLAQTIENMMQFVLTEANATALVDEDITIRGLIAEIAPYLDAANQKKGLALHFDLGRAPEKIRASRRALRSTLLNLALNAIKFTEAGGVTIAIRWVAINGKEAVEFEVSDTGPGISPGLIDRAIEPFAQLSNTSARRYRGLGLGLAVVQRNVMLLGGEFELCSTSSRGSNFVVRVPMRAVEPEPTVRASTRKSATPMPGGVPAPSKPANSFRP
ncbi:MAG: sensor histidine kinase [Candidatus Binataceae bacterium]